MSKRTQRPSSQRDPDVKPAQIAAVEKILASHVGRKNAVDAGKIGDQLGFRREDTHSRARAVIRAVLKEGRVPVGATTSGRNPGYFLIDNERELIAYTQQLSKRSAEIEQRRWDVTENYRAYRKLNRDEKQEGLELWEEE